MRARAAAPPPDDPPTASPPRKGRIRCGRVQVDRSDETRPPGDHPRAAPRVPAGRRARASAQALERGPDDRGRTSSSSGRSARSTATRSWASGATTRSSSPCRAARSLPTAGVSWISVLPTHRRRGILRSMMDWLLLDACEHEEPVLILTASEGGIYGRFGYGVATHVLGDRARAAPTSRGARRRRVGSGSSRPRRPRRSRRASSSGCGARDPVSSPDPTCGGRASGGTPRPCATLRRRVRGRERARGLRAVRDRRRLVRGRVEQDAVGPRPRRGDSRGRRPGSGSTSATSTSSARSGPGTSPIDTELPWLLTDSARHEGHEPARLPLAPSGRRRARSSASRTYAVDGRLVLEVVDDGPAAGRYELDGGPDGATCTRTDAEPHLVLDADALGMIALGGIRPSVLGRAGSDPRPGGRTPRRSPTRCSPPIASPTALTWF